MTSEPAAHNRPFRLLLGSVAATVLLYTIPYGDVLAYPLILLSTYAHEMGHGLAALMVGGSFESLQISADASGIAYLTIPDSRLARAATSAGGLLGPALSATVLFLLAKRERAARNGLLVFGVASLVTLLLLVRSVVGWLFLVPLGVASIFLGAKSSGTLAQSIASFLAVQLSLSVFSRGDYLFSETAGSGPSDVAQIAEALWLPYWFWGGACGAVSMGVLAIGVWRFLASE